MYMYIYICTYSGFCVNIYIYIFLNETIHFNSKLIGSLSLIYTYESLTFTIVATNYNKLRDWLSLIYE